ncbi:type III pantothenate kinase [bacterium]|nr:type III pantothenate kinase [bacterium]
MWLGLDLGNSRLKAAHLSPHTSPLVQGEYPLSRPLPKELITGVEGVLVCSTRSEGTTAALLGGLRGRVVRVGDILTEESVGVENYGTPSFGEDRRLHYLGLRKRWSSGSIGVISAGTVWTLSVWNGEDRFVGGALFPGQALVLRGLGGIGKLPHLTHLGDSIGRGMTSSEGIRLGVREGMLGALSQLVERCEEGVSDSIQWVVTGGEADSIPRRTQWVYDSDLLWMGMTPLLEEME